MTFFLSGAAKPRSQKLVKVLNELLRENGANEVRRQWLRREAEKLKRVSPVEAYEILGGLAALEWDETAMRENHRRALAASGSDPIRAYNFAVSLSAMAFFDEAVEWYRRAFEAMREDLALLGALIQAAVEAGLFRTAAEMQDLARRQQMEEPPFPGLDAVLSWMERHRLSEGVIAHLFDTGYTVLREMRLRPGGFAFRIDEDDELVFRLWVSGTPKQATAANVRITERVTEWNDPAESRVLFYVLGNR